MSTTQSAADTWIAFPQRNPRSKLRLLCLPYAGGDASLFHRWPENLPDAVEVCAVKLPDREARFNEAPLHADMEACDTYTYLPEAPLSCSISAFGGLEDHVVGREDIEAWRKQTTDSFSYQMFYGDHFFMNMADPQFMQNLSRPLRGMDAHA